MKEDIKAKWVEALRSGNYKQTEGNLHDTRGYCCLGVLCDIARQDGVGHWEPSAAETCFLFVPRIDDVDADRSALPHAVQHWAGLPNENPSVDLPDADNQLGVSLSTVAEANDSGNYDFNRIADLIEEQF